MYLELGVRTARKNQIPAITTRSTKLSSSVNPDNHQKKANDDINDWKSFTFQNNNKYISVPKKWTRDFTLHQRYFQWFANHTLQSFHKKYRSDNNIYNNNNTNNYYQTWYYPQIADIIEADTGLLSKCYQGSLVTALRTLYPNHHWPQWNFEEEPQMYWNQDPSSAPPSCESTTTSATTTTTAGSSPSPSPSPSPVQREYLDWLGKEKLDVKGMEDWYRVGKVQIVRYIGGRSLLYHCYRYCSLHIAYQSIL